MYARSRRQNKARLNRMIEMQKNAHPILDESSGQGERFFCGMRKRGCKSASGILLHPLRQCIGGLLLLFFGGERRGAVTLLGAVAAETGVAALPVRRNSWPGPTAQRWNWPWNTIARAWRFRRV